MPAGGRSWAIVALLFVAMFVVGTSELVMAGILPVIASDLQVRVGEAGYLVTAYALSFAVATPLVAAGTGSVQRRGLLVGCLVVFVIGTGMEALAPSYGWLMLARVICAAASGVFEVVATAVAAAIVPVRQRGRAIALVVAGFSVALLIGVPLGTLVANTWGWRVTFAALLLPAVAVALGVAAWVPKVTALERVRLKASPGLVAALVATALVFCGNYVASTFIAVVLEDISGVTPEGVAGALLLLGLGSIVGNALGGYAVDRWGVQRSTVAGAIGMALAIAGLSAGAPWAAAAVGACIGMGFSAGVFVPAQQARLVQIGEGAEALVLALNLAALNLGISTGSALGSGIVDRGGLAIVGYVGGAVSLLAVGLLVGTTSRS